MTGILGAEAYAFKIAEEVEDPNWQVSIDRCSAFNSHQVRGQKDF